MREVEPGFIIDDRNLGIISAIYEWSMNRGNSLDPSKGLLLWGPLGVGKSVLIKGLQRFENKIHRMGKGYKRRHFGFLYTSAIEMSLLYAERGMSGISQYVDRSLMGNLAIDELGREPSESKYFGTGVNVVQTILQLRYEARREFMTHATTNLDPNTGFVEKYGTYVADRVKEMFNVIEIRGSSRR